MNILSFVKGLALPQWLTFKFVGCWLVGLALLGLLWSWNERGHQVQRLSDFESGVISATSTAVATRDKNGNIIPLTADQVVPAINALKTSYTSAQTTITTITTETKAAKARADASDKKLALQLKAFDKQYAVANQRITYLETRPPVKSEDVCKVIANDTNSAWDGWASTVEGTAVNVTPQD